MTRKEQVMYADMLLHSGALSEDAIKAIKADFPELNKSKDDWAVETIEHLIRTNTSGVEKTNLLAWLEKQKEQKPAEWSEEDEEMRQRVIDTLKTALGVRDEDNPIYAGSEMICWIKNLHPQYKLIDEDRIKSVLPPHWKPSEEQMQALKHAYSMMNGQAGTDLANLYYDLKKLH